MIMTPSIFLPIDYLPLTTIWGANSLFLESAPGARDYHPLELEYGQLQQFYGCYATHFAVENTTDQTRVSIDFRVQPGPCHDAESEHTEQFQVGEYYSLCERSEYDGRFRMTKRGTPYWRHGFPFTNK
jgi:hypothetical protein